MATRRPIRTKKSAPASTAKKRAPAAKAKPSRASKPAAVKLPVKAPVKGAVPSARAKSVPRTIATEPETDAELVAADGREGRAFPIEIDPRRIEESFAKLSHELKHWANKGRYTKVRFKFRGKPMLPDLPLAAVVAAEGLTFYWGGILRALLVNVAGNAVFGVELVNEADKKVQEGKEALLRGDLDAALVALNEAIEMDRDHAAAHLQLGVALKLSGDREGARSSLEKAKKLDPKGMVGIEATRLLSNLGPPTTLIRIEPAG